MEKNRSILSVLIQSPSSKMFGIMFIFILLIVLLVSENTRHMADRLFWLDEVTTFLTVIKPFWEIPKDAAISSGQMQPPLFYWFGYLAVKIGTDPLTLRSISLAFYVIMIGFVIFALRELQLPSRIILCFVLIMSPFGAYAATEFRPYSLAALFILISSVLLYRTINEPSRWLSAILYGLAALALQYSLTLNCFVFGLHMVFLSVNIIYFCVIEGFRQTLNKYKPIIIISALLCIEYAPFLNIIWQVGNRSPAAPFHLSNYIKNLWSFKIVLINDIMLIRSWTVSIAILCFLLGCTIGLLRNRWISAYLILLFGGQFLFSTLITFTRFNWLLQRYLVASYVAFALLCAIGANYLFKSINKKSTVFLLISIIGTTLPASIYNFAVSLKTPKLNPAIEAIDALRCNNQPTIVLGEPSWINRVPMYAYRNDPLLIVPDEESDPNAIITHAAPNNICFILIELPTHRRYEGKAYKSLSALPGYTQNKYSLKPGNNIAEYAWLFTPEGAKIKINKDN